MQAAKDAVTPVDCLSLFLPDDMLEVVVNLTNNKIKMMMESFTVEQLASVTFASLMYYMHQTNLVELKAFIGFFYLRGLLKLHYWNQKRIWRDKLVILYLQQLCL